MTIDTARTIEIEGSLAKLVLLALGGVLMTAGGAVLAFGVIPDLGLYGKVAGWCGLIFFGLCTLVAIRRMFGVRAVVITIAPAGIRDTRIAAEVVPWRSIRNIGTWEYQQQKIMVLDVDPGVEKRLTLTRLAAWTRGANRSLGADGLSVNATGVKVDFQTLLETTVAYWEARRGR